MSKFLLSLIVVNFAFATSALAKDFPVQARAFIGMASVDPDNVNEELKTEVLEEIDEVAQAGIEATYPVAKHLNFGLRFTKIFANNEEDPKDAGTDYYAKLDQDSVMAIVRLPLVNTNIMKFDVFGGFGGSNTTLEIKTATQDGEYKRKDTNGWFKTPYSAYGASFSIGYKKLFFVVEGGYQDNKVKKLSRDGSVNGNINTIDLSGSYFTVGLLFEGMGTKN